MAEGAVRTDKIDVIEHFRLINLMDGQCQVDNQAEGFITETLPVSGKDDLETFSAAPSKSKRAGL